MSQLTPTELLFQLKSFTSHSPPSISEDPELSNQLYHAAQAAMVSFEDNPDPISRVAVAQACLSFIYIPNDGIPKLRYASKQNG